MGSIFKDVTSYTTNEIFSTLVSSLGPLETHKSRILSPARVANSDSRGAGSNFVFNRSLIGVDIANIGSKVKSIMNISKSVSTYTHYTLVTYPKLEKLTNPNSFDLSWIVRAIILGTSVPRPISFESNGGSIRGLVPYKLVETHQAIPNINISSHSWSDKSYVAPIQAFTDLLP